jgi:hypothetical protein
LSGTQEPSTSSSGLSRVAVEQFAGIEPPADDEPRLVRLTDDVADALKSVSASRRPPPPQYPASSSAAPPPPSFSSLFAAPPVDPTAVLEAPAYIDRAHAFEGETKRALPRDTKGEGSSSRGKEDEAEPPPAYSEGSSPLQSFTYLMAAAGGASSIITQVQQGGPPINAIGGTSRELESALPPCRVRSHELTRS